MTRPVVDLIRELSALKQRTVEIERELGLGPAENASTSSSIPTEERVTRLRESLKKSLAEWRRTFDAVDLPMAVLDGEGSLLRLNSAALRLAGRPIEHLQFQRLMDLDLPAPWPQAAAFLKTVLKDPTAIGTRVEDPGTGRAWDCTISPDDTEPVESARVILVLRDLAD